MFVLRPETPVLRGDGVHHRMLKGGTNYIGTVMTKGCAGLYGRHCMDIYRNDPSTRWGSIKRLFQLRVGGRAPSKFISAESQLRAGSDKHICPFNTKQ